MNDVKYELTELQMEVKEAHSLLDDAFEELDVTDEPRARCREHSLAFRIAELVKQVRLKRPLQ